MVEFFPCENSQKCAVFDTFLVNPKEVPKTSVFDHHHISMFVFSSEKNWAVNKIKRILLLNSFVRFDIFDQTVAHEQNRMRFCIIFFCSFFWRKI